MQYHQNKFFIIKQKKRLLQTLFLFIDELTTQSSAHRQSPCGAANRRF